MLLMFQSIAIGSPPEQLNINDSIDESIESVLLPLPCLVKSFNLSLTLLNDQENENRRERQKINDDSGMGKSNLLSRFTRNKFNLETK
ncbi:putative small monomeric GTPase [Helianthus debilis subsp. tardiflorus]